MARKPLEDVVDFDHILNGLLGDAYTYDLWGAAYLINAGASDDGFEYFRGWLIAQGKDVFTAALRDPDSLATVIDPNEHDNDAECESILYIGWTTYERRTGEQIPLSPGPPHELTGEKWTEDNLANRLPALWAKF